MKTRVLIVDDEPPARARARRLLAEVPGVEIAGEAGSAAGPLTGGIGESVGHHGWQGSDGALDLWPGASELRRLSIKR